MIQFGARRMRLYKGYILPLIFTKRLCDVFDDELNRIVEEVGSRGKALQLAKFDHKLVRFYLPIVPDDTEQSVWAKSALSSPRNCLARNSPQKHGLWLT
jgi:type I restriction enzyme M protein